MMREIAITQHTLQPPLIPEINREHPVESCDFWGVSGRRFPVATEHLKNGSLFFFFVGCTAMYPCERYGFQAKEERLILGSGIYNFCYQYFQRHGLSFSGS